MAMMMKVVVGMVLIVMTTMMAMVMMTVVVAIVTIMMGMKRNKMRYGETGTREGRDIVDLIITSRRCYKQ